MNKQAPSVGKLLVMVTFALTCFGLLLYLWLAFGGATPLKPKGYRFTVSFGEATQLAHEADVRISGVPVGKVKDIVTNPQTGRSDATIQLDPEYAPIPADAKAILRQKTLLGETYVELTPGSASGPKVPDNGRLARSQVADTVELDEILRTFDPQTREAFQTWIQTQAQALDGRGADLNAALGNLAPFAKDTEQLLKILNAQQPAVRQLVRNTGEVFDALSERDGQLASLITNGNRVFATTAARDKEIEQLWKALPAFERESSATLRRLTQFANNANPVVTALQPAARELSPTLQDLRTVAPDLKALFQELGPLTDASKRGLPATREFLDQLRALLPEFDPVLRQLNPILDGANLYGKEINAFAANAAAATELQQGGFDGASTRRHVLRVMSPINAEMLAQYPHRLPSNRTNAYAFPGDTLQLKNGLSSFETRHCDDTPTMQTPKLGPAKPGVMDETLRQLILKFAFGGDDSKVPPAPACTQQPRFNLDGTITRFPQVKANVEGLKAGLPQP
ncbi:MAG TPA: MlaD family protein [Baekduia sp.]|nr:MlaD family protein [Baekduia sp.]